MSTSEAQPLPAVPASTRVERWLAVIRAHGQPCFVGWPDNIVVAWLKWHAQNRTLIVVHQNGEILGLATGWQCFEAELEQHWYASNPRGDCFYFSHCIATSPQVMADLLGQFNEQWPHWRTLKLYWRRAGKGLVPVKPATLVKLYSLVQRRSLKQMTYEPAISV